MTPRERSGGVLLHIASLPGAHGNGDLGADAWRFASWLASAGQTLWQVLPLNPAGPDGSPYMSPSAFAGNPLFVALEPLVQQGWLAPPQLPAGGFGAPRADGGLVARWRSAQLRAAAAGFFARGKRSAFEAWREAQAGWLGDSSLFIALHAAHGAQPWWTWPAPLRDRDARALNTARRQHADAIACWQFVQWCFDTQLAATKAHANALGIALIGDLPIFVAHDSADCWARPELYQLDAAGQPTVVAGVPPDELGPDGQRWGNPLYRWERMAADGYAWWAARMQRALVHADLVRIDHFRGFAGTWEIPASSATARVGRWVAGPGHALFDAIAAAHGGALPVIAEDLGHITPDVVALRDGCGFAGMKILQFAFGGARDGSHEFLPHRHTPNVAVYTGTHDNDTACGWWQQASAAERAFAADVLGPGSDDAAGFAWALVRAASLSVARMAIVPLQDLLGLDNAHRMNLPGTAGAENWSWRFGWRDLDAALAPRLLRLARASGRAR